MLVRDSGMPDEEYWETLFDVPLIIDRLGIGRFRDVLEFGCGYGTFSIPVARAISGTLHTYDMSTAMIQRTQQRAGDLPIVYHERDIVAHGFDRTADAVLLFNILHCEHPVSLLQKAADSLNDDTSRILMIHWRTDIATRGPAADIRPTPQQIQSFAASANLFTGPQIALPPWHYGFELRKS